MGVRCEEFPVWSQKCPFGRRPAWALQVGALVVQPRKLLDHLEWELTLIESDDESLVRVATGRNVVPSINARLFACVRHGPVRQVREHIMSQPRRSARLRGEPAEYQGLHDHGVPVSDVDDVQCSVCGLTDGIIHQFCGREAHRECAIRCPSCDAIQSEGASLADEEECVSCSTELSPRDRFVVPCCQHALHLECLVRSFESCGVRCPFCQIDLSTLASSPQFQQILGRRVEFDQPIPDPIHQPVVPPPPRSIWPVCCRRVGPPDYSPLEDRRMEWSPVQPGASGGSSPWTFQWVCLTCSRPFGVEDVPPLPDLSCPLCQIDSGVVLEMATRDVRRVCISCNCLVTVPDPPQEDRFSCGPLCGMSPLYGWDARTLSRPGEGTQSWLFCPLISLGMLQLETTLNILAYTTGPRAPVPECQRQHWSRNAGELIDAYAAHFASLLRNDPLVAALTQSQAWGPSGDHLDARLQEQCTPAHILSMMEVWISAQVAGSTIPPSAPTVLVTNFHNGSSGSLADNVGAPSRPLPSPFVLSRTFPEVPPRSPFESQASHVPLHGSVVSNSFTTSLPTENNTVASNRGPPLPGAGPVRLARFLEMNRDQYYATVNAMITAGRFNHMGEASVRLEGQTAWGVWLRIDHWRASRGPPTCVVECCITQSVASSHSMVWLLW